MKLGKRTGLATSLTVLALSIAAAPTHAAPKYLYWANAGGGAGTTIGRATVDGTSVSDIRPSFISGAAGPCMVATDSTHIYWANYSTNAIARAKLDGTAVDQNFIIGADGPCGVAVNATHVFWANSTGTTVGRANINGTGVEHSFLDPAGGTGPVSGVCGVAVDASLLYAGWFAAPNPVVTRATLAGVVGASQYGTPDRICGVAVNSTHVFLANWGDLSGTSISRLPLDFSAPATAFITGLSAPCGLSVDDEHVFWANQGTNTIGRANLDGSGVNTSLISAGSSPCGVALSPAPPGAVSDADPPQTTIDKAPKKKTRKRKVKFAFSSNETRSSFECALNGASFKGCTSPHKVKGRRGKNNFQVRATDSAGNVDASPARQSWKRKKKRRK